MECIYLNNYDFEEPIILPSDEAKHLEALRIDTGDIIYATNGYGKLGEVRIERINKFEYRANPVSFQTNFGERKQKISVAIGLLDDKSRLEFALEKSVELGAIEFIPIITKYCQKSSFNLVRMQQKAIAAIKQCKRSVLLTICNPIEFSIFVERAKIYKHIILADENGQSPSNTIEYDETLIVVGPEGGLSENEINILSNLNIVKWQLGNRRLRAETALIAALSIINSNI